MASWPIVDQDEIGQKISPIENDYPLLTKLAPDQPSEFNSWERRSWKR